MIQWSIYLYNPTPPSFNFPLFNPPCLTPLFYSPLFNNTPILTPPFWVPGDAKLRYHDTRTWYRRAMIRLMILVVLYHVFVSFNIMLVSCCQKEHDISCDIMSWFRYHVYHWYHVSTRDMIYHDTGDDTQWYIMIVTWYMMIYDDILYWNFPFLVLKIPPIPTTCY